MANLLYHRRKERIAEGKTRSEVRNKRTPTQQLTELDARLGKGVGAVRERAKLASQLLRESK